MTSKIPPPEATPKSINSFCELMLKGCMLREHFVLIHFLNMFARVGSMGEGKHCRRAKFAQPFIAFHRKAIQKCTLQILTYKVHED